MPLNSVFNYQIYNRIRWDYWSHIVLVKYTFHSFKFHRVLIISKHISTIIYNGITTDASSSEQLPKYFISCLISELHHQWVHVCTWILDRNESRNGQLQQQSSSSNNIRFPVVERRSSPNNKPRNPEISKIQARITTRTQQQLEQPTITRKQTTQGTFETLSTKQQQRRTQIQNALSFYLSAINCGIRISTLIRPTWDWIKVINGTVTLFLDFWVLFYFLWFFEIWIPI